MGGVEIKYRGGGITEVMVAGEAQVAGKEDFFGRGRNGERGRNDEVEDVGELARDAGGIVESRYGAEGSGGCSRRAAGVVLERDGG